MSHKSRPVAYLRKAEAEGKRRGVGRNDPCPCGSGTKYKYCCLDRVARHLKWKDEGRSISQHPWGNS